MPFVRPLLTIGIAAVLAAACGGSDSGDPTDPGNPSVSCSNPPALGLSGSVSGSTKSKPCKQPPEAGGEGWSYSLTLSQPANLEVAVAATGFAPYLGVFTAAGGLVTQSNSTINASKPMRARLFLAAGSYVVWVGSLNGDGGYTLTSGPGALDGCSVTTGVAAYPDLGNAVKGVTITGTVSGSDCSSPDGGLHFDIYQVYLKAGTSATVSFTVDRAAYLGTADKTGFNNSKTMTGPGTWTTTINATSDFYYGIQVVATTVPVAYTITIN